MAVRFKTRRLFVERYQLLLIVFFVLAAVLVWRLYYLQILKGGYYGERARKQHSIEQILLQQRGEIFMHSGFKGDKLAPLVINRKLSLVYAVPKEIQQPAEVAKALANIFLDQEGRCHQLLDKNSPEDLVAHCQARKALEQRFYEQLNKPNDPYEPLRHKVDEKQVALIKALGYRGIYFKDEWERYYPEAERASQVTGFLGFKVNRQVGQYGIEGYYENELAGEAGKIVGDKDVAGHLIPVEETKLIKAKDGDDIVLSLDKIVQDKAYEILAQAVKDYGAEDASLIVMEPASGKIRAMVNYPSFDANKYSEVEDIKSYKNLAVSQAYEPGSIFKIITMAAGLDSGAVKVDDTYEDKGFVQLGRYKIKNAENKKYGEINMTKILENSVNTGAVHVALLTGKDVFKKYVKKFGFGAKWGVGLEGEAAGDISSLNKPGKIYLATASYGQGITVTPLQMAVAMCAIANNGVLIKPTLIERIGGRKLNNNKFRHEVINKRTAEVLKAMLVSVVKNGHGKRAQVKGYYIGGKTGTAEIASASGGYSNENNHSFIGFGPLDNPRFVIMVKLSKPKWGRFSAVTAAPTFQKMAKFLLQYYEIPPDY